MTQDYYGSFQGEVSDTFRFSTFYISYTVVLVEFLLQFVADLGALPGTSHISEQTPLLHKGYTRLKAYETHLVGNCLDMGHVTRDGEMGGMREVADYMRHIW